MATDIPRGPQHHVTFETYRDALFAWYAAMDKQYKYAFYDHWKGRDRELGRALWLKYTMIADACYAEVRRLKPPPPPPFCKCCKFPFPCPVCLFLALTHSPVREGEKWSEWFVPRASGNSYVGEEKPLLAAAGGPQGCQLVIDVLLAFLSS